MTATVPPPGLTFDQLVEWRRTHDTPEGFRTWLAGVNAGTNPKDMRQGQLT